MDSFDLHIEQGSGFDVDVAVLLDPPGEFFLVFLFNCVKLICELLVFYFLFKFPEDAHGLHPTISSEVFGVELGQALIGTHNPSSWSDTVRFVLKLVRVQLIEFFEKLMFYEFTVNSSHSVYSVASDHAQIRHSNFLRI